VSELLQAVEATRREVVELEAMQLTRARGLLEERALLQAIVTRLELEASGAPRRAADPVARLTRLVPDHTFGVCLGGLIGVVAVMNDVTSAPVLVALALWSQLRTVGGDHVS
jgi:hypothetical protein